ncbi:MAG: DUF5060 domain-containing protein [Candidatus Omnitrophica bacterium]|nr:DUF5060 domain-containing protein [Candidatus Omnitrophota bacterium]
MKRILLLLFTVFVIAPCWASGTETTPVVEGTETILWDGFESRNLWTIAPWGDAAKLTVSAENKVEGQKCFKVSFGPEGKQNPPKGVVLEREQSAIDLDTSKKLTVDIFNDGPPFELALVLYTDEFIESSTTTVRKGLNKDIEFDLHANDFKSPNSKWQYSYTPHPGTIAWRIMFIMYAEDTEAKANVYFDNMRLERAPRITSEQKIIALADYTAPDITAVKPAADKVEQYEKFEIDVAFGGTYQYPYNPDNIDLMAYFKSPDGKKYTMPGFLYSGKVDGVNVSDAVWKVRFAPVKPGKWEYYVTVKNPKGMAKSETMSFECLAPSQPKRGFARISKKDPLFFEFENGEYYYPLGQNVAWAPSVDMFEHYFSKMHDNMYNWTRVWMSSWQCAIEWLDVGEYHGLNNYNLKNAKLLDDITDLAKKYDLYYQLVLNQHGQLSTKIDQEWLNNPYNKKNGGPCGKPSDFLTNAEAKRLYKMRVRYIIARWGYSTNILAWEPWNELTLMDGYDAKLDIPWQKEMAQYMNSVDPHRHMITTSYFGNFPKEIWKQPEISYGQIHMYTPEIVTTLDGLSIMMKDYKKAYFVGEYGGSNLSGIDIQDPDATVHHNGIWAAYMTASSGNAMPWQWDEYIDPNNLYFHWHSLAKFNEGEDRRGQRYGYSRGTLELDDGTILMAQGILNNKKALIWVYDLYRTKFNQGALKPLDIKGAVLTVAGMDKGNYRVEFWDTYKGDITGTAQASSNGKKMEIALPEITKDFALKVVSMNDKARPKACKARIESKYLNKEAAEEPRDLWEGFEAKGDWDYAGWGDIVKVSLAKDRVTEGKSAFKVVFNKAGRRTDGKGICVQNTKLDLDLSKAKKMVFDVYLDAPNSIEVSVVLNSKGFCESVRRIIVPGWNRNITFDLMAKTFKKESTKWQHKGEIDRAEPMKEVMFMFYPWDVESGSFYLDNIGFRND